MVIPLQIVNNSFELVIPASFLPNFGKHNTFDGVNDQVPEYSYQFEMDFISQGRAINFVGAPEGALIMTINEGYRVYNQICKKLPRRDLRFNYKLSDMLTPQLSFRCSEDGEVAAMVNLVPTFEPPQPQEYGYFAEKPCEEPEIKGEEFCFIFIIDRSGSMSGRKMRIA